MKKILILSSLSLCILFAVPQKEAIDQLVEQIKPPRVGVSEQTISVIKNPFVFVKVTKDKKGTVKKVTAKVRHRSTYRGSSYHKSFKLYATLNKSAKINHRWIPLNGKINGYTLKGVSKQFVTLQRGSAEPIKVYLNTKNKNINLMTK